MTEEHHGSLSSDSESDCPNEFVGRPQMTVPGVPSCRSPRLSISASVLFGAWGVISVASCLLWLVNSGSAFAPRAAARAANVVVKTEVIDLGDVLSGTDHWIEIVLDNRGVTPVTVQVPNADCACTIVKGAPLTIASLSTGKLPLVLRWDTAGPLNTALRLLDKDSTLVGVVDLVGEIRSRYVSDVEWANANERFVEVRIESRVKCSVQRIDASGWIPGHFDFRLLPSEMRRSGWVHTLRLVPKSTIDPLSSSAYPIDHFTVVTDDADEPLYSIAISCAALAAEFKAEISAADAAACLSSSLQLDQE